jgi:DNA-binding FadR family transcriptional regulator
LSFFDPFYEHVIVPFHDLCKPNANLKTTGAGQDRVDGGEVLTNRVAKTKGNSGFRFPAAPMQNVHSQIAERLGLSIVSGEIPPGEPLPSEARICEMMVVSRTVVREAIRTLVSKGLLESRPKSGTRVRSREHWNHLDPEVLRWRLDLADTDTYLAKLFQLRMALDPIASAIAATSASEAGRDRISVSFEAMASANDNEGYVNADIAFHKAIYLATENEFFWPIAQMFDLTLRQSFSIAAPGTHRSRAIREHREILDAILAGNALRAQRATEILLGQSATDLAAIRGNDLFSII